jgi:hypothetical protein
MGYEGGLVISASIGTGAGISSTETEFGALPEKGSELPFKERYANPSSMSLYLLRRLDDGRGSELSRTQSRRFRFMVVGSSQGCLNCEDVAQAWQVDIVMWSKAMRTAPCGHAGFMF